MLGLYLAMLETTEEKSRFEHLYMTHRVTLYNYAYQILKDVQLAEDAVSETFLILVKKMKDIEKMTETEIRNYLIIIAKNKAKKIYSERVKQTCSEEFDEVQTVGNTEWEVVLREEASHVFSLIQSMDEKYADIFYLRYCLDLKEKEIAALLGLSVSTIKSRIYRGKKQLQEMIEKDKWYDRETV